MSESLSGCTSTYRAFLSYSHADKAWADWLHKALETYRVPARLVGTRTTMGTIPKRLTPVFRDRDELASATDLGDKVNAALAQSAALVVICSPHSAASRWVNEEVLAFKRIGRGDRIFCLIVDGEPNASEWPGHEHEECFCPALGCVLDDRGQPVGGRAEPIAADARPGKDGKANAKLKLIAGLLGTGFDTLVQREAHRRRRRMLAVTVASVAAMTIAVLLALNAYVARNEARQRQAQTEDALNYMLGDLHDKLEGMGRLDLMASVADKALALFTASKPGLLTDRELTQESRALVQIGEIRWKQGQYGPAMDAFKHAYQRSAELTRRHPRNGRFLFDRAQAEFYVGEAYRQQLNQADANVWLTRYRDSTLALLTIDAHNKDWQLESTYGAHALAVLALDRGDLDAARTGFLAELATQRRLAREQPGDPQLTATVADTISWLGNVAEQRGDLAEALRLWHEQTRQYFALRTLYPDDFRWLAHWTGAQKMLAASLINTGHLDEGLRVLSEADAGYRTLTGHDPDNVPWQVDRADAEILRAIHNFAAGHPEAAEKLASAGIDHLQSLGTSTANRGDRLIARALGRGWELRARIALQHGDLQAALAAANRALVEARNGTAKGALDDGGLADQADALLVLGRVQQLQSPGTPPPAWTQAHALLAARAPDSRYWRLLDPWLRLCRLSGDATGAQIALERLNASGYVPLQPWPAIGGRQSPAVATEGSLHEN